MRCTVAAVGLLLTVTASGSSAQTVYSDVEYIRGREALPDKIKGQLIINDSTIGFARKDGQEVMSIPIEDVKHMSNSFQNDPAASDASSRWASSGRGRRSSCI